MKSAWFVVTCKVDNGCTWTTHESLVYAPTISRAKYLVTEYWNTRDSETVAHVVSARMLSETEIFSREV